MEELIQEFVDSRGLSLRVDRERGILRGVKLLGLESRNGRRYLPAALKQAAALYEGAKVNVNHPKGHPLAARDYQDRLGAIQAVAWCEGAGLFGDLYFNPKHQLAEQLIWDAEHAPHNVGLSHNVQARTARQSDELVIEAILKVTSVDLVADPATTRGLFESAGADPASGADDPLVRLSELTLEQLQAARPDLITAIQQLTTTEARELRAELDRLKLASGVQRRRELAVSLLREHKLPSPDSSDPIARSIVSQHWLESVIAAPSESAMRQLVTERADLVAALSRSNLRTATNTTPTSREQTNVRDRQPPLDAAAFARLIR